MGALEAAHGLYPYFNVSNERWASLLFYICPAPPVPLTQMISLFHNLSYRSMFYYLTNLSLICQDIFP